MAQTKEERKAYTKAYYQKNKRRILDRNREAQLKVTNNNMTLRKQYELKAKFGISAEDYNKMFSEQNGVCAICKEEEVYKLRGKIRALAVDHCHKTGKVRKLLCSTCNNGLGCFKDNPELMKLAIEYLQNNKEEKE